MCLSTRSSQYTQYTSDDETVSPEPRTVAQQFRDHTLAHRGPSPPHPELPHYVPPLPPSAVLATPRPPQPTARGDGFGAYSRSSTDGAIL